MFAVICTLRNTIESIHRTEELAINAARRAFRSFLDYNPTAACSYVVLEIDGADRKGDDIPPHRWRWGTLIGERTFHTRARNTRYTIHTYAADAYDYRD